MIHIVFQGVGQKTGMIAVVTFDMPHKKIPASRDTGIMPDWRVFSHTLRSRLFCLSVSVLI
jgi:hypothetical protein